MNIVDMVFRNQDWWVISKPVARKIGLECTVLLMEHVYIESTGTEDGWYPLSKNEIEDATGISEWKQRDLEKELINHGFLSKELRGMPAKNYYFLNKDQITAFLHDIYDTGLFRENHASIENKGTSADSDDKRYSSVKITDQDTRNPQIYNIEKKESFTKDSCLQKKEAEPQPKKRSRLKPKNDDEPVAENPIIARSNRTNSRPPLRPIKLADRTREALEYWNKFPELGGHRIDEDNPTRTLVASAKALGQFFNGTILEHAYIPKHFHDHEWFEKNGKLSLDQFKDLVYDFVQCLKNPNVKPVFNGERYSLVDFLIGNKFMDTKHGKGMPSAMLMYCFGNYQTVAEDKFPAVTMKIKKMWEDYIGKYRDTPENERGFVEFSNMCGIKFNDKREAVPGWTPAMGEYKADGIARNIIKSKASWLKEARKSPEILGNTSFTNMVRRYDYDRSTGRIVF